jgi:O-antigen ligase
VSWLGAKEITKRFSTMKSIEVTTGKRASMRRDTWRIFMDHPWVGTGLGTLQIVFPPYETQYDGKVVNHSHNDYVEALAETGVLGGLCCALFLGMLLFHSMRQLFYVSSAFASVLNLSGMTACTGFLAHSFVDFNLHLPANALLFFLMATLATSKIKPAFASSSERSRGAR